MVKLKKNCFQMFKNVFFPIQFESTVHFKDEIIFIMWK